MKKLLFLLLVNVSFLLFAQSVKLSTKVAGINVGTSIKTTKTSVPQGKTFNLDYKSKESLLKNSTITTNKAIFKDTSYPVYATNKGKLFIIYPHKDVESRGYVKKYLPQE